MSKKKLREKAMNALVAALGATRFVAKGDHFVRVPDHAIRLAAAAKLLEIQLKKPSWAGGRIA